MKIAITYDKDNGTVFQHFGRTEYFYLYDGDTKEEKVIDNGGYSHHELAFYLKSLGVDTLICGGIGSHGIEAVLSAGLNIIPGAYGDIKEVMKAFLEGRLQSNFDAVHSCSHEGHHNH